MTDEDQLQSALEQLPRWACAAFAARCAGRVLSLLQGTEQAHDLTLAVSAAARWSHGDMDARLPPRREVRALAEGAMADVTAGFAAMAIEGACDAARAALSEVASKEDVAAPASLAAQHAACACEEKGAQAAFEAACVLDIEMLGKLKIAEVDPVPESVFEVPFWPDSEEPWTVEDVQAGEGLATSITTRTAEVDRGVGVELAFDFIDLEDEDG